MRTSEHAAIVCLISADTGVGATTDAKKIPVSEVKTLPKIPVMPISYEDAEPLLKNLGGDVVPETWRGNLPLTYHVGPGTYVTILDAT